MVKKRNKRSKRSRAPATMEDGRAEFVTVAWMLATITTLGAEVIGGLLRVVLSVVETAPSTLIAFPNLMLFTAGVTGIVCLSLTPLVYRFRRVPPPTAVTVLAVTVSVIPLTIGVVQSLR